MTGTHDAEADGTECTPCCQGQSRAGILRLYSCHWVLPCPGLVRRAEMAKTEPGNVPLASSTTQTTTISPSGEGVPHRLAVSRRGGGQASWAV
jgi:hypothetical protein